jgi:hypothetical protein
MIVGAIVDPNILLAAETDECGGTVEERARRKKAIANSFSTWL